MSKRYGVLCLALICATFALSGCENAWKSVGSGENAATEAPAPDHDAVAAATEDASLTATQNDDSDVVSEVQEQLNALGYDAGAVDGIYGARTKRAIAVFELDQGLPARGVITPALRTRLATAEPRKTEPLPVTEAGKAYTAPAGVGEKVHAAILDALSGRKPDTVIYWSDAAVGLDGTVTVDAPQPSKTGRTCFYYSRQTYYPDGSVAEYVEGSGCEDAPGDWALTPEIPLEGREVLAGRGKQAITICAAQKNYTGNDCQRDKEITNLARWTPTKRLNEYLESIEDKPQVAILYENPTENFTISVSDIKKACGVSMHAKGYTGREGQTAESQGLASGDVFLERNLKRITMAAAQKAESICPQVRQLNANLTEFVPERHFNTASGEHETITRPAVVANAIVRRMGGNGKWLVVSLKYRPGQDKDRSDGFVGLFDIAAALESEKLDATGVAYREPPAREEDQLSLCNMSPNKRRVALLFWKCNAEDVRNGAEDGCSWSSYGWANFERDQCKMVRADAAKTGTYMATQTRIAKGWQTDSFAAPAVPWAWDAVDELGPVLTTIVPFSGCGDYNGNFARKGVECDARNDATVMYNMYMKKPEGTDATYRF